MVWFLWTCVVLGVLLAVLSPIVPLVAARRLLRHLKASAETPVLRDLEALSVRLQRCAHTAESFSVLAARASAARELFAESLRHLRSPLFYFGRLP